MTEEKKKPKKRGKYCVVDPLFDGCQHIAHPDVTLAGARDIVLGPYEAKIISHKGWKDSPLLEQAEKEQHRVKTYWSDKRPASLPVLPPEAPQKRSIQQAIQTIAFGGGTVQTELGSGQVMEESVPVMLINLVPDETTSFQGPGRRQVLTSEYLKKVHYETLYWAKWLIEHFPRAPFPERLGMIEKRMAEIEEMP